MKTVQSEQKIINTLLSDKAPKKYQGKEVVVLGGEIYTFPKDDKKAGEFFNKLIKKNPDKTPTLVSVPKNGMYILLINK